MNANIFNTKSSKIGTIALIIGVIGTAISLFGFKQGWDVSEVRPILSWLIAIGFWLSILVGMLFLIQIWWVFHARWPTIIRRQCEHCIAAFPYLLILFLPLLAIPLFHDNPGLLWKWMSGHNELPGHGTVAEDPLYVWKSPFLNIPFFIARAIAIFAVFIGISNILRKWSFNTDLSGNVNNTHWSRRLSSLGIFLCAIGATCASIDWFKSLEYHWFSTMYGVWFFSACIRAALASIIILCVILATNGYLKGILKQSHRYDISCMMLAFTVFWAYISFSQYFLIYSANIPEETFWYNIREKNYDGTLNSWWWVSMGLIFGHFLIPFLLLLWYKTKVVIWRTVGVSIWILLFHILDLYWNILPGKLVVPNDGAGYLVRQFTLDPYDFTAFIGIGGFCIFAMCRSMQKVEPIPVRDPNILESLNYSE